jgi:hypothetical protein
MNLTFWLPALFILGIITLGLLTAFIRACDKV